MALPTFYPLPLGKEVKGRQASKKKGGGVVQSLLHATGSFAMAEEEDEKGLLAEVGEDEDLNGEDLSPLGRRRRRRERGRWAAEMKVTSSTSSGGMSCKSKCRYALCTILVVMVAAILSLAVGLFVGQSLGRRAVRGGDEPAPSPHAQYNWGDTVMINGSAQNVAEYFASHLSEEDIRNYLS